MWNLNSSPTLLLAMSSYPGPGGQVYFLPDASYVFNSTSMKSIRVSG